MLIQTRAPGLRLIRQHDHGLLAGELARAWRGPDGAEELDSVVVLATALHDLGWLELDRVPIHDPDTGRPFDFLHLPVEVKYDAASGGIDEVEELHPYAAVLVSLHYSSMAAHRPAEFDEEEEVRRAEILDAMEDEAPGPRTVNFHMRMLRLFDNLSLFLCLTPPGAAPEARPSWLTPELLRIPSGPVANGGREGDPPVIRLTWTGESSAVLEPFPFGATPLTLPLPYRDLDRSRFADQDELEAAWREAPEEEAEIEVVPP